jgi:glucose-fructose oxidoreductase
MNKFKIVGINFDHMHMGDLLRKAKNHPDVEIVGISDEQPDRVMPVLKQIGLDESLFVADYRKLMDDTRPDMVILCPSTAQHADWTEKVAPFGTHVFVEKPFSATLADADRMIAALEKTGKQLIINWPLRWYPTHVTAKRLVDEGAIGEVIQVHYYDGNRGPLRHMADKVVVPEAIANEHKAKSWWYQKQYGGGSLLDYLGYGVTLGTWFMNGKAPVEVTSMVDQPEDLEVDEHSITICRYDIPNSGLSKFETRWGTFSDCWAQQPQPKCGFVIVGRRGTIASYDHEKTIRLQTDPEKSAQEIAVDTLAFSNDGPISYVVDKLTKGELVDGPLSPMIARIGQQIVDSAVLSAAEKRTVSLVK